eukprot:367189-Lingulodinium_polyedra.AAC.1
MARASSGSHPQPHRSRYHCAMLQASKMQSSEQTHARTTRMHTPIQQASWQQSQPSTGLAAVSA